MGAALAVGVRARAALRLTTQPLDLPEDADAQSVILDQLNAEEMLMFASDFPHNHTPASATAFLEQMPATSTRRIMRDNAAAFYRLPA